VPNKQRRKEMTQQKVKIELTQHQYMLLTNQTRRIVMRLCNHPNTQKTLCRILQYLENHPNYDVNWREKQ